MALRRRTNNHKLSAEERTPWVLRHLWKARRIQRSKPVDGTQPDPKYGRFKATNVYNVDSVPLEDENKDTKTYEDKGSDCVLVKSANPSNSGVARFGTWHVCVRAELVANETQEHHKKRRTPQDTTVVDSESASDAPALNAHAATIVNGESVSDAPALNAHAVTSVNGESASDAPALSAHAATIVNGECASDAPALSAHAATIVNGESASDAPAPSAHAATIVNGESASD
eukprot:gene27022-33240_t